MARPVEEPPLTPEEEEEAPCSHEAWEQYGSLRKCSDCGEVLADASFVQTCVKPGCIYDAEACYHGCGAAADELADAAGEVDEEIEAWPCGDCGAMVSGDLDWCPEPDCQEKARKRMAAEAPPQPERRPPYAVAYSVGGHLYELHVPGDAAVKAEDGGLIIQHHLGPVAGIVQVLPVINKEGAHGAE